jgi:hypothetical protein
MFRLKRDAITLPEENRFSTLSASRAELVWTGIRSTAFVIQSDKNEK